MSALCTYMCAEHKTVCTMYICVCLWGLCARKRKFYLIKSELISTFESLEFTESWFQFFLLFLDFILSTFAPHRHICTHTHTHNMVYYRTHIRLPFVVAFDSVFWAYIVCNCIILSQTHKHTLHICWEIYFSKRKTFTSKNVFQHTPFVYDCMTSSILDRKKEVVAGDDKPISSSCLYATVNARTTTTRPPPSTATTTIRKHLTDQTNLIVERKIFTSENLISESDAIPWFAQNDTSTWFPFSCLLSLWVMKCQRNEKYTQRDTETETE